MTGSTEPSAGPSTPSSVVPGPAERVPEPRPSIDLRGARKVHVMGIGGSAMGNFAGMLQAKGLEVRGSDAGIFDPMRSQLERWQIPFVEGYAADNLDWGPDVVVVGNVIRRDNPEAVAMRARGLPYCSFPEALGGWLLADRVPVVVAGTHGKTTTTSLIAWLLQDAGLAPGLLVGGVPANLGRSFQLGEGRPFVVEGDEYDTAYFDKRPKFVHYAPHHAVLTSIEFDHADIYPDLAAVQRAFELYASLVDPDGLLAVWGGDARVCAAATRSRARVSRYGLQGDAEDLDVVAREVRVEAGAVSFDLSVDGAQLGRFASPMPGLHNVRNALAALTLALDLGVDAEQARASLAAFRGVKKRQEIRGVVGGVTVLDDYAHHPTAVRETIDAIRGRYPDARLWALFEAESNTSRRRVFQDRYPPAFKAADEVIFCAPLIKQTDKLANDEMIDPQAMVAHLNSAGVPARFVPDVEVIADEVSRDAAPGDVVLAMSGRDFRGLHELLLSRLRARFGPEAAPAADPAAD